MKDNENGGQGYAVYRLNTGLSVCCALMSGVLLSWNNAYANTEEFATVHIGESANNVSTIDVDSQSPGVESLEASAIIASTGTESKPIHTDVNLPDTARLDTGQGNPYSQLDLAGSQDMRSLDVDDTGSSVEFPNAVGELGGGIDDQRANVDPGDQPVTDSNDMMEQSNQPLVTDTSVKLPVINATDAHSQVSVAGNQLEDVSNDAVSEESAGLPYAVVLALLALIGLVPVARRSDRHQV